ncbi:hypothetical protein EBT16_00230 [bacterium]|nr:hypothetical protein [bacterium]
MRLLNEEELALHLLLIAFRACEAGVIAEMNATPKSQEVPQKSISYPRSEILDKPELVSRYRLLMEIRYEFQVSV